MPINTNFLSPTKQGMFKKSSDHGGNAADYSPMSSNVSSFYYDRIEELLPEKKLIAMKLFKN